MSITGATWVVLWSPHQRCFHIETLDEMLETNRRIFAEQNLGDYILLGFAESRDAALESTKKLKPIRNAMDDPNAEPEEDND